MPHRDHLWPAKWYRRSLPWLSAPGLVIGVVLMCLPFALVTIPPLVDLPGHMGASAIELAGPDSPLARYFGWRWMFALNLGGEVLMKAIGTHFGIIVAGWVSTVLAVALFAGGCIGATRALNPRGGYGVAWALLFVFSFPLLTGFLNYILATGLSLCAFAASVRLEHRPRLRVAMLVVLQPIALISHAIGGVLLPLLIGAYALGRVLEDHEPAITEMRRDWHRPRRWRILDPRLAPPLRTFVALVWPLLVAVITIVVWKVVEPGHGGFNKWRWDQKAWSFVLTLRDQSLLLDVATTLMAVIMVVLGRAMGARWSWPQLLPGLSVFVLFVVIPSDINGSAFVDMRLLPVAAMLLLGLQDWSGAPADRARFVAISGAVLLGLRLVVTGASFVDYAADYKRQLGALDRVAQGSRVLAFVEHSCVDERWRNTRRDHLASLASIYREAWVNDNWSVPGLDMLQSKFRPARYFTADPSEFVWSPGCQGGRLRSVDTALKRAPIDLVDYVWLIDTGLPKRPDPRLRIVWQEGRSVLFAVKPLGFSAWTLSQL